MVLEMWLPKDTRERSLSLRSAWQMSQGAPRVGEGTGINSTAQVWSGDFLAIVKNFAKAAFSLVTNCCL